MLDYVTSFTCFYLFRSSGDEDESSVLYQNSETFYIFVDPANVTGPSYMKRTCVRTLLKTLIWYFIGVIYKVPFKNCNPYFNCQDLLVFFCSLIDKTHCNTNRFGVYKFLSLKVILYYSFTPHSRHIFISFPSTVSVHLDIKISFNNFFFLVSSTTTVIRCWIQIHNFETSVQRGTL